jgi:hypothetical protein
VFQFFFGLFQLVLALLAMLVALVALLLMYLPGVWPYFPKTGAAPVGLEVDSFLRGRRRP